jgi:hypothetical protein
MSRFNMLPREGHLKAVKRILCYLKIFPKGRLIIDTSYPDNTMYPVEYHSNWMEFYSDAGEEIPKDLPPEKGPRVRMTVYVDADHAYDVVTRRSITGILVMLNNTPITWISKGQRRQRRHKLMDQNWWLQGMLRNSFLKLGACFGHWERHWMCQH